MFLLLCNCIFSLLTFKDPIPTKTKSSFNFFFFFLKKRSEDMHGLLLLFQTYIQTKRTTVTNLMNKH